MNFDMNRTWSHCVSLVQANFQLLAVLAGVFILIPNVIFYIAAPEVMMAAGSAGMEEDQLVALLQENAAPLIGFGLLALVAQFIGYGALVALMGNDRPTVGEALRKALSAIPTLIGATLLMILAYLAVGLTLALVAGVIAGVLSLVLGAAGAILVSTIVVVAAFAAIIYVLARFIMVYPAVMLENIGNPVTALKRSWALTKPHAKRIFLFLALVLVAYLVISLIVGGLFGVLTAAMGSGPGAAFVSGLVNGVLGSLVAMVYAGIMVAMHGQLAGSDRPDIGETFD